jgi:two-component system response regulator NreC
MAIKILIADDHPLIARGIQTSLEFNKEIQVLAIVSNGKEALEYIEKNTVDILLLDIDMPVMNGIDCASILLQQNSATKIVILSMHQDAYTIKKVMELGVKSYLLKTIPSKELLFAIDKIHSGESYFNSDVTKALLENKSTFLETNTIIISPLVNDLTKREKEIIQCICQGMTNSEIGEKLFISPRTADTHRTNIMRKLDVHNVVSLVRFALKNNLS